MDEEKEHQEYCMILSKTISKYEICIYDKTQRAILYTARAPQYVLYQIYTSITGNFSLGLVDPQERGAALLDGSPSSLSYSHSSRSITEKTIPLCREESFYFERQK